MKMLRALVAALALIATPATAGLDVTFGLQQGWPVAPGQQTLIALATALLPNTASFPAGSTQGTVIWTPTNKTAGSTITFSPSDGRIAVNASGGLVVGATAASTGTIAGTVTETLAGASNSPQSTSLPITVSAAAAVPPAPTVTATAGSAQNSLAYTDGSASPAITSHKLYRGTAAGAESLVGSIASASPYIDTGLTNGTSYFYKLSAVNSVGEGPQSSEVSATPVAASATQALRVVASGPRFNDTAVNDTNGKSEAITRTPFWMGGDATEIRLVFNNWYYAATGATTNNVDALQIYKAAIETSTGTIQTVPVTFSGARGTTMAAGANMVMSDALSCSAFTGQTICPKDTQYWIREDLILPDTSGFFPTNVAPAPFAGSKAVVYPPANEIDQVDATGAMTTPTNGGSSIGAMGAVAVLGRYTNDANFRSICETGDSITLGVGDLAPLSPIGSGFVSRSASANAATGTSGVPTGVTAIMMMSRAGSGIQGHYANTQEMAYLGLCKTLLMENGTNSIGSGTTNSTLINSYLIPYVTAFRNAGGARAIQLRITPKTTSTTGNFVSMADQTPAANRGAGSGTSSIDDWESQITGLVSAGTLDLAVAAPELLDATDPHYWLTNTFTGNISSTVMSILAGTQLSVTTQPTGALLVGQTLYDPSGNIAAGTTITAITAGNPTTCSSGTPCKYTVSTSQLVNSEAMATPMYMTNDGLHPNPPGHIPKGADTRAGYLTFPYLLRRDLDPAANDNAPAFLNKAA